MILKDNYDLFIENERQKEEWLEKRPTCIICGKKIQDEYAYDPFDNHWLICERCLREHRVFME